METKCQIQLLKDLVNDIESSTEDLAAINARYRELIVNVLPFILSHEFNVDVDRIPSSPYLKEMCAEDKSRFETLQKTIRRLITKKFVQNYKRFYDS